MNQYFTYYYLEQVPIQKAPPPTPKFPNTRYPGDQRLTQWVIPGTFPSTPNNSLTNYLLQNPSIVIIFPFLYSPNINNLDNPPVKTAPPLPTHHSRINQTALHLAYPQKPPTKPPSHPLVSTITTQNLYFNERGLNTATFRGKGGKEKLRSSLQYVRCRKPRPWSGWGKAGRSYIPPVVVVG